MAKKKKKKKSIMLGATARQKLAAIIVEANRYLATARDVLNVPEDWVVSHDQNGIPSGFAPPEKEK